MISKRRKNYIELVEEQSISLFYSGKLKQKTGDQFYPFSVNRNFFYLTNIDQADSALLIAKSKGQSKSYLFIEKRSPEKVLWDGAVLSFEQASKLSGISLENIMDINQLDAFVNQLISVSRGAIFGEINKMYFDLERQSFDASKTHSEYMATKFKNTYSYLDIKGSQHISAHLRMRKDELEIKDTLKAIDITKTALNHIMKNLKPGINEYEIEAEYNYVLNKNNTTTSFDTIAASGENACVLHYVDNDEIINDNELILFDLGVKYNNYCSDISRTYPANGKFTDRQRQIYDIVLKANKETIKWLKPGVSMKEFNEYGKQILIDGAKEIGLIKEDSEISKYYYHSLGHYLGLDVHDVGIYDELIPEGAIITVEPGLYIAEEGIGIRIEDDILITKDGNINLSKDIIKEAEDIEKFMNK